ncbi:MAG: hypothetical protein PHT80_06045, partial [Lentisphaeria bacterium]|nr:hypothetical protein [Lentisphaeria bacterium]
TFTLGGETFGGPNTSPRTDAWVITFHAGGDQVLRWRVLPCRPIDIGGMFGRPISMADRLRA